mmetsp:Transcript_60844/g.154621  ORF Transcript_60844/g.154621 Transcript_60844/m.154621 type:complete len:205 (+) Transcript_60844:772-1386(+)
MHEDVRAFALRHHPAEARAAEAPAVVPGTDPAMQLGVFRQRRRLVPLLALPRLLRGGVPDAERARKAGRCLFVAVFQHSPGLIFVAHRHQRCLAGATFGAQQPAMLDEAPLAEEAPEELVGGLPRQAGDEELVPLADLRRELVRDGGNVDRVHILSGKLLAHLFLDMLRQPFQELLCRGVDVPEFNEELKPCEELLRLSWRRRK